MTRPEKPAARSLLNILLALMLFAGSAMAAAWAIHDPAAVAGQYRPVSRVVCRTLSRITGIVPFSVIEILIGLLLLTAAAGLVCFTVRMIRRPGRLLRALRAASVVLLLAGLLLCLFLTVWGLNYFAPDIDTELGLEVRPRTVEDLTQVTAWLVTQLNDASAAVERSEDGTLAETDFARISDLCCAEYDRMAEEHPFFAPSGGRAKPVLSWYLLSKLGITGIYLGFTGECNINGDVTPANLPFVMAHEMAHRMCVAPEDEANFTAYLVLRDSSAPQLRYSAYYSAFIYCYNALYRVDREAALDLFSQVDCGVYADIVQANERYDKYEGELQELSDKVNNFYLQTMQQPSGTRSYGEVVDLIMAQYFAEQ